MRLTFKTTYRTTAFFIIGLLTISSSTILRASEDSKKPNIIIVITDDQGKNDLACEGNPYIKTPNLDSFYSDAVRLTNFHVSTTCAPTRGALMSGRHSDKINVFHTISGRSILFEDEQILPQVLAQSGYTNGMFGKWHLGDNYPYRPMDRGFHEVVRHGGGGVGQGPDYWGNDYFDDTYWHNGTPQKYSGYCTDVFFGEAIKFIEDSKDKPFFCYISTNAPHGPLNCPEEYMDMYKDAPIGERVKRFYGMITNIDDNFKILNDKLKELGIDDNTIVVFMSDNGTASGSGTYDAGMQGHKGSVYEGGHRTPFYIKWPKGNLVGGRDVDELTAHYDILPTFVDLLDIPFNPTNPLDGLSLAPLLNGDDVEWKNRILFMDTQRELNLVKYKSYTVMDEKWRLVNGSELYDVTTDLKQKSNIIGEHPEVAARLSEGYERWWQSILDEDADIRYSYIKVGTPYENPTSISAHDLLSPSLGVWHQNGACSATPTTGRWKVEFATGGEYKISLCRFPRSSGLAINETFPALEHGREIERALPASVKDDFKSAFLYLGKYKKSIAIEDGAKEVTFNVNMSTGRYDLEASLLDSNGLVHPAYYLYIEKLD